MSHSSACAHQAFYRVLRRAGFSTRNAMEVVTWKFETRAATIARHGVNGAAMIAR